MRSISILSARAGLALAGLAPAFLALPQAARLNDPLPAPGASDVTSYALSSDGSWLVYRADAGADGVFELFSVPTDHSAPPVRLHPPLASDRDVYSYAVAAGRVLYAANQLAYAQVDLFSVPIDGSAAPVQLSPALPPSSTISWIWIAPDGVTALFTIWEQYYIDRLYRVPIDGSQPAVVLGDSGVGISTPFAATGIVELQFTADGQRAVFESKTYDDDYGPSKLMQVPLDGSQPPVALSVPDDYENVRSFVLSLDGSRVAYMIDDGLDQDELHAVAIDGSGLVQLALGAVQPTLAISADGGRVAFVQGHVYSIQSDGTQLVQLDPPATAGSVLRGTPDGLKVVFAASGDLYSAPIDGSASATLLLGPGATPDFAISADSTRVAAVVSDGSFRALYGVPTAGGVPAVLLNGPAAANRGVAAAGQMLALQGARVAYRQERGVDEVLELWSAPLDGGQPEVRVCEALDPKSDVQSFLLLPDGQRAVYLADQEIDEAFELFGTRLDGSTAPARYNPPFPAGPILGDVTAFATGAGESRVVFHADQDTDETYELFSAPRDGNGPVRRISGVLPNFQDDVRPAFVVSATAKRVAYEIDLVSGPYSLYSTRGDGFGTPVLVDQSGYDFPVPYLFSPDETRLLYRKGLTASNRFGLFIRRADGSGPVRHLNPNAISAGTVLDDLRFTPDGQRVVFRGDQIANARNELFSVPSDGSSLPVRINAALMPTADVQDFRLSPDGARAVYRANARVFGVLELFAAPVAGGGAVRLTPLLASDRDVSQYAITPDGERVVYRADQQVDEENRLYSVPITGLHPPTASPGGGAAHPGGLVPLTPLASGQDVRDDFALQPDGSHVYFTVAAPAASTELYRVPIGGGAPPQKLNGPLVAGGNVTAFQLSPDGQFLVYLADERADERFELFGVPLGGGAPVALDTLPAAGDVTAFQICPDAGFVIYRADRNADEVFELFAAPLDGSAPPRRLNGPLAAGGDVQADFVALTRGRALFRADETADEVLELFLGFREHGPLQASLP